MFVCVQHRGSGFLATDAMLSFIDMMVVLSCNIPLILGASWVLIGRVTSRNYGYNLA